MEKYKYTQFTLVGKEFNLNQIGTPRISVFKHKWRVALGDIHQTRVTRYTVMVIGRDVEWNTLLVYTW